MLRGSYQSRQLITGARGRHLRQVKAMSQLAFRLAELPAGKSTPGLGVLLKAFGKFADDYAAVLDAADPTGNLQFLLHTGIERLLPEWSILSRACEQRSEANPRDQRVNVPQPSVRYYLEEADKLLESYCKRWHYATPASSPYLPLETPVAYFEKLYRISRALFAPQIPVISIPLSDYNAPDNWQALAHEVGHHIFWNAIDLDSFTGVQREIRKAVSDALLAKLDVSDVSSATGAVLKRLALWDSWLEETFADVCGVLFAGPAFALSAQDLAAASVSKLDDLIGKSDEQHPSPYLRPLIALQVVREVAASSPADYREKLLDWAGRGEVETKRRAPAYEDQLRARRTAQAQSSASAKRLPAELDVAPEMDSLLTRWLRFSVEAAKQKHPAAKTTLEELANDVPVVVKALLYAHIWPDKMRLWDLVEFPGYRLSDKGLPVTDLPSWGELPSFALTSNFPPIPKAAANPQFDFQRVLNRVIGGVEKANLEETEKRRLFWALLSAMDVEADSAEYPPHAGGIVPHPHPTKFGFQMTWKHEHPSRTTIDPEWSPFL